MAGESDSGGDFLHPAEVEPIVLKEFMEILGNETVVQNLFEAANLTLSTSRESGFVVSRDIHTHKRYISKVHLGGSGSFNPDEVEFPDFPEDKKGTLCTHINEKPVDRNSRDNWPVIDVFNIHMHPPKDKEKPGSGWFGLSPLDFSSMFSANTINALKLRVLSGIPLKFLRSLKPPEGNSAKEKLAQSIHHFYGLFYKGFFGRRMDDPTPNSIEANYRTFDAVGMVLSKNKFQVLVLHDDPTNPREQDWEIPKIYDRKPRWLKGKKEVCENILDSYRRQGYWAEIIFFEKNDQGKVKVNFFSQEN